MSTTRCANKSLHWVFTDRRERTGQHKSMLLYQPLNLIAGQSDSKVHRIVKKKRELFPRLPPMSPISIVLPLNIHSPVREFRPDSLSIAGSNRRRTAFKKNSPISQDRLTHVQLLFTWNLSPLQSSKFSFEYLLLLPRSALESVPFQLALQNSQRTPRPPTQRNLVLVTLVQYK